MEKLLITDLSDEIMYTIFARINVKSMLQCRAVCKKWLHLINDEKRLINRLQLCIHGKHFRDLSVEPLLYFPEIIPKFTNVKLIRMNFDESVSNYLMGLLPAVQELNVTDCIVEQQDMMALFDNIFSVSNKCVDQFKLAGFTILPSAVESDREVKRIKLEHSGATSLPIVKNFHVKISDTIQTITFFKHLKEMNVVVERLSIHLDDTDDLCKNFHYERFDELLNLFHCHYQHLIKELTIDLKHVRMDLDRFYGRLSAMKRLKLEVLRLKVSDGLWLGGVFKVFIKNQFTLKIFETKLEMDREAIDILKPIFPNLDCLKIYITSEENYEYFWRNFNTNLKLKKFKVICPSNKLFKNVIDFEKVPALEKLGIKRLGLGSFNNPELEFRNLRITMTYLKILKIYFISVDERHLKLIFDHLCHLEELKLRAIGGTNNRTVHHRLKSINNLKFLEILWLDLIHIDRIKRLKLPNLKIIGFFKFSYKSGYFLDCIFHAQNRKFLIKKNKLKTIAKNCPSLLEICDDQFGTMYHRSGTNEQFCRTRGNQSDSDTETSESDA